MAIKYIDLSHNTEAVQTPKQLAATITAISKAASAVVTAANDFSVNDVVGFASVAGMTEINGLVGTISARSAANFTVNIDSTLFTTYTSGGTATKQQTVTGEVRILYSDAVAQDVLIDALQRAKELLGQYFATS